MYVCMYVCVYVCMYVYNVYLPRMYCAAALCVHRIHLSLARQSSTGAVARSPSLCRRSEARRRIQSARRRLKFV
jgi:hypothetical protein